MNIKEITKHNNLTDNELQILSQILKRMDEGDFKIPIRDIARDAYVSTTSVIRLAKKLGYEGYSEMLYDFKQERMTTVEYKAGDNIRSILQNEFSYKISEELISDLASMEYERIYVVGVGYSNLAAEYFSDKLEELDYRASHKSPLDFDQPKKSITLFISESGETHDLIFIQERCRALDTKIYCMSANENSTLCKYIPNHIVLKKGRDLDKFPNYFIGNSINYFECLLAVLYEKLKGR